MRVTIIGAGAIGGLAGAYMTQAGHEVLLVDRWAEHVAAMNRDGLFIDGIRGEMRIPVAAVTPDRLEGPLEAVLIATKSQHTAEALELVLPRLAPDGFIVSFQNGFNEPLIAEALTRHGLGGMERVIGSIPNYGGALVDPGHLEFVHEGPIQLGEMDGRDTPRLRALTAMLASLTTVQLSDNIWGQIWAKEVYFGQIVFTALVDAPIHDTLGVERYARVAGAIVREGVGIAAANGITLQPFDFFDPAVYQPETPADTRRLLDNINKAIWLLRKDQKPTEHRFRKQGSGMWWDIVYRKRKSEVEAMQGKLVAYGDATGADTRLNTKLCQMIYEIEEGRRPLGFGNLDEMERYVAAIGKALP
ncbi:ketopantoate reductase family protein [Roseomonas sp. BN140053]|uniref:ketopantoate reductase family protein n=1 Tax=Roseomonas sp. BN140053 TaxID=3391898 RepID=UPI0039EB5422